MQVSSFNSNTTADVAILGAGMSGLRAAQVLQQQRPEANVILLEGRDTPGGRIRWTHMEPSPTVKDDGALLYVDEGAQYIHGINRKNPLVQLANQHKIRYQKVDWDDGYSLIGPNQRELPSAQERKEENALESVWRKLAKWRKAQTKHKTSAQPDVSLESVLEDFVKEHEGSDSISTHRLWTMLHMEISDDYAEDLSQLSALHYDQDDAFHGGDAVPSSYQKLVEVMLPADPACILYQHVVQSVVFPPQADEPVCIHCRRTDTEEDVEIRAKRVICTLPLGVLKKQQQSLFTPPLPHDLQASIQRLGFGCLEKIWLHFACDPFWPTDADAFYHLATVTPFRAWFLPARVYRQAKYRRMLCCFVSGTGARALADQDEATVGDRAVAVLREILSVPDAPSAELLRDVHVTRWATDPWTGGGSYSHLAVGSTGADFRAFEGAFYQDRLWFAGEATHAQYPSTVHGAYLAGERAARACGKSMS